MKTKYKQLLESAVENDEYWTEVAVQGFASEVEQALKDRGLTRADLANLMNRAPAYVTRVLRGNANVTLATVARFAKALELVPRIHLAPRGSITYWVDESASVAVEADFDIASSATASLPSTVEWPQLQGIAY